MSALTDNDAFHDYHEQAWGYVPVCLPSSPTWVRRTFLTKMDIETWYENEFFQKEKAKADVIETLWARYADCLEAKNKRKEIDMLVLAGQTEELRKEERAYQEKEENFEFDLRAFSSEVQQAFRAHDEGLQEILQHIEIDKDSKENVKQCLSSMHLAQLHDFTDNHTQSWDEVHKKSIKKDLCDRHDHCDNDFSLAVNLVLAMMKPMVDNACSPEVDKGVKEKLVNHGCHFCKKKIPKLSNEIRAGFAEYNKAAEKRRNQWCGQDAFNDAKKLLAAIKKQGLEKPFSPEG